MIGRVESGKMEKWTEKKIFDGYVFLFSRVKKWNEPQKKKKKELIIFYLWEIIHFYFSQFLEKKF